MASKRSRIALSPSQPEAATWETENPTVGAQKLSQNPTLAMALDNGVQQQEKQPPKSFLTLGLATSEPAKRRSPPRFGEFLQACRWCRRMIGENSNVYMYGYLGAFCSPECRENQIKLDRFPEERYSKSG